MIKILVTGGHGQLGQAMKSISDDYSEVDFVFMDSSVLNICNLAQCEEAFNQVHPDFCFNFAAYTAVDKAEDESDHAFLINAEGVKNIAEMCKKFAVTLVQISTDFVFDGEKNTPYIPLDIANPINVYGASKLRGEEYVQQILKQYYIVRTSWLYSDFGSNFKKTMLRLSETRDEISVVDDQIGCPTDAVDLSAFLMRLIDDNSNYGIYHFSGDKVCSWFDFAVSIFAENKINIKVNPILTSEYPTKARRPRYSVLG